MKNIEFMQLCLMAGFNIFKEDWINEYLLNFNAETIKNHKDKEIRSENNYLIRFDDIDQNTPEILNMLMDILMLLKIHIMDLMKQKKKTNLNYN